MGADTHVQVSPEIFDCVQSQALAGPLTELCTSQSCCVLWFIVLLEGEPSARLNALDWALLSLRLSLYFGALSFFSILMSPSVPAAEKHPHSITFYFWDGTLQVMSRAWFPSNISLGIEVHQNRESCFSQSESSLDAFLQIPSVFSCVYTEERILVTLP